MRHIVVSVPDGHNQKILGSWRKSGQKIPQNDEGKIKSRGKAKNPGKGIDWNDILQKIPTSQKALLNFGRKFGGNRGNLKKHSWWTDFGVRVFQPERTSFRSFNRNTGRCIRGNLFRDKKLQKLVKIPRTKTKITNRINNPRKILEEVSFSAP